MKMDNIERILHHIFIINLFTHELIHFILICKILIPC